MCCMFLIPQCDYDILDSPVSVSKSSKKTIEKGIINYDSENLLKKFIT